MENNTLEAKYRKLASEYSKLRAQASVLKTAVIEEQNKSSTLRENLRQKETSLRRSEHEVDSLGFRNKQLERRVASLQEDIASKENRKSTKNQKSDTTNNGKNKSSSSAGSGAGQDTTGSRFADYFDNTQEVLIFEELQKKILENAELTSSIDDKNQELQMHAERIFDLEKQLEKRTLENMEIERRLRKEIDSLQARISELETKLVEAASMIGSEDALSASGSDNTPLHTTTNSSTTSEDRIAYLEKEVSHWRTQYEISRISDSLPHEMSRLCKEKQHYNGPLVVAGSCCSTAATGLSVIAANAAAAAAGSDNNKGGLQNDNNSSQTTATTTIKEQLIFNNFSKKFEDLLKTKCMSESRLASYQVEADHLHNCLENSTQELKDKDTELLIAGQTIQTLEEDLATTRVNYEEQISVLTEQVISLSEQLASCK